MNNLSINEAQIASNMLMAEQAKVHNLTNQISVLQSELGHQRRMLEEKDKHFYKAVEMMRVLMSQLQAKVLTYESRSEVKS